MTNDCGHGLHQKAKIQGVGEVCLGCDPSWQQVAAAGPYSLFAHRADEDTVPSTAGRSALEDIHDAAHTYGLPMMAALARQVMQARDHAIVADILDQARRRLFTDAVLSARAKTVARVLEIARRTGIAPDDQLSDRHLIAAVALVVAEQVPAQGQQPWRWLWRTSFQLSRRPNVRRFRAPRVGCSGTSGT